VRRANQALRQFGIEVYVARITLLPEGYAGIKHRRDRRRLASFAPATGRCTCSWSTRWSSAAGCGRIAGSAGCTGAIAGCVASCATASTWCSASDAPATTLVHELGHLFGLEHDFGRRT
jgi:hypothetical protein